RPRRCTSKGQIGLAERPAVKEPSSSGLWHLNCWGHRGLLIPLLEMALMFTWCKRMGVAAAVCLVALGPATDRSSGQMTRRSMMSPVTMHRPFRPFRVIPHHPNQVFQTQIGTQRAQMLRRDLRLDRLAALSGLSGMSSMNPYMAGTGQPYGGDGG